MPSIPPMLTSDKDGHEIHFQPPYLGPTSERGRYMNTRTGGELEERSPSIPTTLRRTSSASPPCHADEFSATETERIVNQNPNIFAGTTESQWQALLRPANLSTDELEDAVRTAALKALHGINGIETADGYSRSNLPSYQRKNISSPHGSTPKSVSSPSRLSLIERATVEMKATREARLASAAVHAVKLKEEAEAQKAKSTKEWSNRQPTPVKPFATTVHQSTASSSERALSRGQRKASPVVFYDRSYPTAVNVGAAPSGTKSPRIAAQKASFPPTKDNVPTISTNASNKKETEPTSTASPIEPTAVLAPSPSAAKRSFTRRPLYEDPLQRLIAQTAKSANNEKLLTTSKAYSQSKGVVGQTSIAVQQNRKVEPLSSLERQLKAMAVQEGRSYLSPSLAALLAAVGPDGALDDPSHASKHSVSVVSTTANLPESLPWGPLCASLFIIATLYPSITMERLKMGTSATMAIKKALVDVAESPERKRNPLPSDADATSLLPTIPPSEEKEVARAVAAELLATYEGKHQQLFALLCKRNSATIETVLKDVCEDLRKETLASPTESPPHDDAHSSYKKPWDKRNLLHVVDMVLHLTMPTAEYAALIEQLSASVLAHKRTKNWPSVHQIHSGGTPRKVSVGSHTSSKITPKRSGSLTTRSASAPQNSSSKVNTTKIAAGEIRPSIYPSLNTSARARVTSPSPQPLRGGSAKAFIINPYPSLSTVLAGPHAHYSSQHHLYPLRFPTIIPLVIPSYTELGLSGIMPSATRKLAERFGGLVREQLREIATMRPDHGEGSSKEASPEVEAVEIILDGDGELGGEKEEPEVRPITEAVEAIHIAHHPPPVHNEAVTESSPVMSDTERLAEEW